MGDPGVAYLFNLVLTLGCSRGTGMPNSFYIQYDPVAIIPGTHDPYPHIPPLRANCFMSLLTSSFHLVSLLAIDISLQSSFSTIPTHHHSLATICWLAYWAQLLDKLKRFNQTTRVLLFSKGDTTVAGSVTKRCACPQLNSTAILGIPKCLLCTCHRISPAAASQRSTCCHHQ